MSFAAASPCAKGSSSAWGLPFPSRFRVFSRRCGAICESPSTANVVMLANAGIHGGERRNWRSGARARAKALDPRFRDPAPQWGLPPTRVIWISSGLRGRASGLREFPAFARLELFGIPWILSSEMSLFNGLHATPGQFYFQGGPFRRKASQSPAVVDSKIDPTEPARRAEEARQVEDHGGRHRKGPIGHWDQTNAVFAFWQEIVDTPRFLQNLGGRSRARRSPQLHRRAPASGARRGPRGPFGRR